MNKFVLAILGILIAGAAIMAGMFLGLNKDQAYKPVSAPIQCVDFDPPSTLDTITYNGIQYDLIKKDVEIIEEFKFKELTLLTGNYYALNASNFFGQKGSGDLIFVLKNTALKSPYIFDIYLKDGVAIPDYIKNCKSTGGTVSVVQDQTSFPPYGFNRSQITGLIDNSIPIAFVYSGNRIALTDVDSLVPKPEIIGNLFVASKNQVYPLYFHLDTIYLVDGTDAYEYIPSDNPIPSSSEEQKSLQLKKVTFVTTRSYSWWTPSCKPAIYLYPEKSQNVNVKVNTKGYFTLTIPQYPTGGWSILANPDGRIQAADKVYPYLYYESKVPDSLVKKPDKGYVVQKNELPRLFDELLPRLGLKQNELTEFKNYWEKALPDSKYYFIGVMNKKDIDNIEPLDISPLPRTAIRVRLYFELLDKKINVVPPVIKTPQRVGFTMVEWGGMVKTDKDSTFTCSQ